MFGGRSSCGFTPGGSGNTFEYALESRSTSIVSACRKIDTTGSPGCRKMRRSRPRAYSANGSRRVASSKGLKRKSLDMGEILARLGARLVTRRRQPRDDLGQVVLAARLDHELDLDLRRRRARESALVQHRHDVRAGLRDRARDHCQLPRLVAHEHEEAREPRRAREPALD